MYLANLSEFCVSVLLPICTRKVLFIPNKSLQNNFNMLVFVYGTCCQPGGAIKDNIIMQNSNQQVVTVKVKKPVDSIEKLVFEDPKGYQSRCMWGVWQFRETPDSPWQLMNKKGAK